MNSTQMDGVRYPAGLVDWAGHHSGGVKRFLDDDSGQPNKALLKTNLLARLENWTEMLAADSEATPRIILLVGGPGNGKTEAIESTVRWLDSNLRCGGRLIKELSKAFHPTLGTAVPRIVTAEAGELSELDSKLKLSIVQDGSSAGSKVGDTGPMLLVAELTKVLQSSSAEAYLCCVNRGVLDDALIYAIDNQLDIPHRILEAVTRAVSLTYDAPSCWPLEGFSSIAVWPMDAESLLIPPDDATAAPAEILFEQVTNAAFWPIRNACPAKERCPFCTSQAILSRSENRLALLDILRWYELASAKRWSFRDLFSLISYLLAGHHSAIQGSRNKPGQSSPCEWAEQLVGLDQSSSTTSKHSKQALTAIYHLTSSGYQHALFHSWDTDASLSLQRGVKELGLDKLDSEISRTLVGLAAFIGERKANYLPATISPLLEGLAGILDPALASPELIVAVSSQNSVRLGDLDVRFSRSVGSGFDYVKKYRFLSKNEIDLLKRLSDADEALSMSIVRKRKPLTASRVQRLLRDFACRLVRRSLCTRTAVVADRKILKDFELVVMQTDKKRLHEVAQQVKTLLNTGNEFEVSLTTTFGQPLPPEQRQATLVVPSRHVKMLPPRTQGRPRPPLCYLSVGQSHSITPIPLTYDLFKAVKELEMGLSPASLPLTVLALLDTTKARLSGAIVRDEHILEEATIRIGSDGTVVTLAWDGFSADGGISQ